jgi:hypothetical protein
MHTVPGVKPSEQIRSSAIGDVGGCGVGVSGIGVCVIITMGSESEKAIGVPFMAAKNDGGISVVKAGDFSSGKAVFGGGVFSSLRKATPAMSKNIPKSSGEIVSSHRRRFSIYSKIGNAYSMMAIVTIPIGKPRRNPSILSIVAMAPHAIATPIRTAQSMVKCLQFIFTEPP